MLGVLLLSLCLLTACGSSSMSKEQAAQSLQGIQPGEARAVGDGVVFRMHRIGVPPTDASGWQRAVATQGGFSVDMPLPFNELSTHSTTTDGVRMRSDTIGGKTPGLLAVSATCIAREDGTLGPGDPPKTGETQHTSPNAATTRTLTVHGRICTMTVEAQGADPMPDPSITRRFLDSLVVEPAPPTFAPALWSPNPPPAGGP